MKYELLLMNLSRNADRQYSHFRECLGQHSIAAYLAQHDFRAQVYSGDILKGKEVLLKECEVNAVKIVGFYLAADNLIFMKNFISWIKSHTDLIVIVGGPESNAQGEAFLRETGCDFIMPGEGEIPMYQLLSYLVDGIGSLSDVNNIRYLDGEIYRENSMAQPICNLDSLPTARRVDSMHRNFRMGHSIGILTGRGCPFHCAFCFEGAASKIVRYRSVQNVMQEIDEVRLYNPKLKHVNLYDDTFTLNRNRVLEFCREFKARGLTWTCEGHVSCIYCDEELLREMVESGLRGMQLGIESGDSEVLSGYHKHTTPEMIVQAVALLKKVGIEVVEGNYIIGGAFESHQSLEKSLAHAKELLKVGRGILELSTVYLAPYSGTPISRHPDQYGLFICQERAKRIRYSMAEDVVFTEDLSCEDIIAWKKRFDTELLQAYFQEAKRCTKEDIYFLNKSIIQSNGRWMAAYAQIPHLAEFQLHLTAEEQTYHLKKYPIRTGNDYFMKENQVLVDEIRLEGIAGQAWLLSNGIYTVEEIAHILQLTLEQAQNLFCMLNNQALLYFSPF